MGHFDPKLSKLTPSYFIWTMAVNQSTHGPWLWERVELERALASNCFQKQL